MSFASMTFQRFAPRVNEFYHADFQTLLETHIPSAESVLWVGNYSFAYEGSVGYGGYIVVTLSRLLQITFSMQKSDRPEVYVGIRVSRAMSLPNTPLKLDEVESRWQKEILLSQFSAIRRTNCKLSLNETLVRLDLHARSATDYPWTRLFLYNRSDAQELCEIISRYSPELDFSENEVNISDQAKQGV